MKTKERNDEKERSKEREERKERVVVVEGFAKATTTCAGAGAGASARTYDDERPLQAVTPEDIRYIVEVFNGEMCRTHAVIPTIDILTNTCRRQLTVLLHKYPMAKLVKMTTMAAESNFLNGGGQRGFKADLEWLTREQNFLKVINGKYNNIPADRQWRDPALARMEREQQRAEQRQAALQTELELSEQRAQERERWARERATPEQIRAILGDKCVI